MGSQSGQGQLQEGEHVWVGNRSGWGQFWAGAAPGREQVWVGAAPGGSSSGYSGCCQVKASTSSCQTVTAVSLPAGQVASVFLLLLFF